ncbi:tRNA dimethylallyltransferase, mitochondrial [Coemansia biformis]|uniref:tRNA dimethylallyltransferase n=1 Tax=Coemansia biformis TaxID=1286918 RepID=A0A9W8CW87_9FUNG|nr:tRNA dimethylallyltransferase, mitochondrial [Coemansia biformis]
MALIRKGLIAITGTTGVGKSQLAIEVARALNGEVINADALQVYRGYDIITNKVGQEEAMGVRHHLLGIVDSAREYTVQDFERDALDAIREIHARDKVAVLVGGTNYYIQSVMFRKSLISETGRDTAAGMPGRREEFEQQTKGRSNEELWRELQAKDPVMAENWHANNRRKVLRSLEVLHTTGKKHSEWIRESEQARAAEETLRFPTLLLWLYADSAVLNPRLDARVDTMVERGLLGELRHLVDEFGDPSTLDFTTGLRQAIGFRELAPCLRGPETDARLLQTGLEAMRASTRRYAKRQIVWIRNKLLPECRATQTKSMRAHAFVLDATDLDKWNSAVRDTAIAVAHQFVAGREMPAPESLSSTAAAVLATAKDAPNSVHQWRRHRCSICSQSAGESADGVAREVWLNGDDEYQQHLHSRQHRKNSRHRKRAASTSAAPGSQGETR